MKEEESNLLDDYSHSSHVSMGAHYTGYTRWLRFCGVVVGLLALFGILVSGFVTVNFLTYGLSYYRRLEDFLILLFLIGSGVCCFLLLLGCWQAFQYDRALRSATFVNVLESKRWEYASPQAYRLWRLCGLATLTLVLSWGPILLHFGYEELSFSIHNYYIEPAINEPFPGDDVPVEEPQEFPPQEIFDGPTDLEEPQEIAEPPEED